MSKTSNIFETLKTIRWALRYIRKEEQSKFLAIVSLTFFKSLIPAGLALVGRELINTFVLIMDTGTKEIQQLYLWLFISFILTILDAIMSEFLSYWNKSMADVIYQKLNLKVLAYISQFNLPFFENASNQDLFTHIQKNSLKHVIQLFSNSLSFISILVQTLSLTFILIYIEPLLSLLLPFVVLPYYYAQLDLAKVSYQKVYSQRTRRRWTRYFVNLLTDFNWVPEVKMLNLSPLLIKKFNTILIQFNKENRAIYLRSLNISLLFVIGSTIGIYLLIVRVSEKVIAGVLTLGDVTIYTGTTFRLRTSFQNLIQATRNLKEQSNLVFDLKQFLEEPPPIQSKNNDLSIKQGNSQLITFENVSFSYPNSEKDTLSNVSFQIQPGEKLALVGVNGAGKSTLVKLLARLYEPTSGRILYGNIPIKEFSKKEWQQQISFVFQNYIQFEATVQENLAYGDWERLEQASDKEEQIKQIVQQTKISGLVDQLPQGYQTKLGRKFGTHSISLGQWQKLAIARTMVRKNSDLLILDEPTASLDVQSEFQFLNELRQLSSNQSVILISHRFSTLSIADRIIVLENGVIIGEGTHEKLLAQNGQYANLYQLQNRD